MFEDGRTVRVGLIGYGYAGKTFHAPLIQSVAGLELTIVGSSKRETVLADLPGVTVCSNMEEVATHSEVDLLVIASPNESHFPLAAAALHAGRLNSQTLAALFNLLRNGDSCSRYFTTAAGTVRFWQQRQSWNQVCWEKLATLKLILTAFARRFANDGASRLVLAPDFGSILVLI